MPQRTTDTANPLRRGRARQLLESKGRTQNKETMAMKNIFRTIRQWQRRNSTIRMLNRLDDHMLADIGITRGELSKAVHIFH